MYVCSQLTLFEHNLPLLHQCLVVLFLSPLQHMTMSLPPTQPHHVIENELVINPEMVVVEVPEVQNAGIQICFRDLAFRMGTKPKNEGTCRGRVGNDLLN